MLGYELLILGASMAIVFICVGAIAFSIERDAKIAEGYYAQVHQIPNPMNKLFHQKLDRRIEAGEIVVDSDEYWQEIEKLNHPDNRQYFETKLMPSRFD